jgi:hypothetical protein
MHTKIGLDKFPVPSIRTEVPLFDIVTGEKLVDQGGLPLVTEADRSVIQIAQANRSTSAILDPATITPIPVIEQFPITSETSTSLLGIDRSEVQLSLFSDVSVLGFDTDSWEFFSYRRPGRGFGPWINRGTRDFLSHYDAEMIEVTDEQAIQIGAFPVPYEYPFGPRWEDQGLYIENLYQQYKLFIELGNVLYIHYSESGRIVEYGVDEKGREFRENFLNPSLVTLNGDDVIFEGISDAEGFTLIDTWTRTWIDIQSNLFLDPRSTDGRRITVADINGITGGNPLFANTRPGYESDYQRFGYMQSRKTYRYQPGRISGFTFGARISTDSGSAANTIEWGISNPTDQYVFQVRGASFSIVRRSTVPLDSEVLLAQGLDPVRDQTFEASGEPFDFSEGTEIPKKYYTISIPRDNFNGDTLDGNGRSGYLLNPDKVTMYKIEFGWYGAIGAKFYCYIPIENGEARWVLMHTLVIENKLGQPCLEDPYFRFKYAVNIKETSTVRTPQFIYKYGASCFIDGGDQGTVTQRSYSSGERLINSNSPKSLIGIWPKTVIINKNAYEKVNKKIIYPISASVSASELTHVEIVTCKACPGYGHTYNHGLGSSESGRVHNIRFLSSSLDRISVIPANPLDVQPSELFTLADVGSKIIADGLWAGYISSVDSETSIDSGLFEEAVISRIVSSSYVKTPIGYPQQVFSHTTGNLLTIPFGVSSQYPYQVRLTNYDSLGASTIPLTGSKIEIQFLNPIKQDGTNFHFAEFLLGVTDKKPVEVFDSSGTPDINWEYGPADVRSELPIDEILYGEWTPSTTGRTRQGYETSDANYPSEFVGELDYRIPTPQGLNSGRCSKFTIEVLQKTTLTGTMILNNPATGNPDGNYYLVLSANTPFGIDSILGGEIGLSSGGSFIETGIHFESNELSYADGVDTIYYALLAGQLPGVTSGQTVQVALTPVRIFGKHVDKSKVMQFNPYPLYLVTKMRDNAIINSISIKETVGDTSVSSTPKWLLNSNAFIYPEINNLAVDDLPPVNFISGDRLDSATVDIQAEQTLRPYETLDSFYVGANQSSVVDLTNIYGPDRETITPDLFNIEATFFIGTTKNVSTGTIQISINTAEQ